MAAIDPSGAERIISVVGATGVCAVSYIHPVAVHLCGYRRGWRHPDDAVAAAAAARYHAWHYKGSGSAVGGSSGARGEGEASASAAAAAEAGLGADGLGEPLLQASGGRRPAGTADTAPGRAVTSSVRAVKGSSSTSGLWARSCTAWEGLVEPLLVLFIGVGFSVAALYVAVATLLG